MSELIFISYVMRNFKGFKLEKWCGEKRTIYSDMPFEKPTFPDIQDTNCGKEKAKQDEFKGYRS